VDVFTGLLHDAPETLDLDAHRALGRERYGWVVGPLIVPDNRLATLGAGTDAAETAVSVLLGTGAGGLLALARRRPGARLAAVETVLRDLDDLAGNAARVVSAAESLPEGVDVYVGCPGVPGMVEAVETIEAASLLGRVDLSSVPVGPSGYSPAEQLSLLVEADLPFKVTGASVDAFGANGVGAVLTAVEALIDGADPDEAAALLAAPDPSRVLGGLARWDTATQSRVQRRLRGVDCPDLATTLESLVRAGLLEPTD
jgi:hypothetical protein